MLIILFLSAELDIKTIDFRLTIRDDMLDKIYKGKKSIELEYLYVCIML